MCCLVNAVEHSLPLNNLHPHPLLRNSSTILSSLMPISLLSSSISSASAVSLVSVLAVSSTALPPSTAISPIMSSSSATSKPSSTKVPSIKKSFHQHHHQSHQHLFIIHNIVYNNIHDSLGVPSVAEVILQEFLQRCTIMII